MNKVKIYKVGGCVRDHFLSKEPKDIDYAVEADSFETMKTYLEDNGAEIYLCKPEYLTIRANYKKEPADFVLCRHDGNYKDGRRPDSVEIGDIYADLARRDFCCNSIAQNIETGEYIDPYGGIEDIKNKRIRCVGSFERLVEDYLRILRAIRFWITLDFSFEYDLLEFLRNNWKHLDKISIERIVDEVNKMIAHDPAKTIESLRYIDPNLLEWVFNHEHVNIKLVTKKQ